MKEESRGDRVQVVTPTLESDTEQVGAHSEH